MARKDKPVEPQDEKTSGDPERENLVRVAQASNPTEAEPYRAELEAHGIPAILDPKGNDPASGPRRGDPYREDPHRGAGPGLPDGRQAGVPVRVPERLTDEAAELIAELETLQFESEDLTLQERDKPADDEREDLDDLEAPGDEEPWEKEEEEWDEDWDEEEEEEEEEKEEEEPGDL